MFPTVPIFCLLTLSAFAGAAARDLTYEGDLTPRNIMPTFARGYLVAYENPAGLAVYAPDGRLAYRAVVKTPEGEHALTQQIDATAGGQLAVAVNGWRGGRHQGGVAILNPQGQQIAFIDTGEYLPTQVAFGPDQSIWTLGFTWPSATRADYSVLHHYSQDGKLTGEFLPRSSFDPSPDPAGPIVGGWRQLHVSSRGIGAVFYITPILREGETARKNIQWIELDFTGKVLGRWDLPRKYITAYTDSGNFYGSDESGISILDRASGNWKPVPVTTSGRFLGADGENLVFKVSGNTLRWSE